MSTRSMTSSKRLATRGGWMFPGRDLWQLGCVVARAHYHVEDEPADSTANDGIKP